jgi:hypothetical protein
MAPADIGNTPAYWIRPTQVLSAAPGFHRFVWDVHFAPPAGTSSQPGNYPISATPGDTPREPRGPFAAPGQYTVRLTVGGKSTSVPLVIKMDPRVKTPATVLAQTHAMAVRLYDAIARDSAIAEHARVARDQLRAVRDKVGSNSSLTDAIGAFDQQIVAIVGQGAGGGRGRGGGGRGRGGAPGQPTFASINGELMSLMTLLEDADAEPTSQALAAVGRVEQEFATLTTRWTALRTTELAALNAKLRAAGQQAIAIAP